MTYEPLNRRLAILATVFAFLGVILGVIALATNYWTYSHVAPLIYNESNTNAVRAYNGSAWNVRIVLINIGIDFLIYFHLGTFQNMLYGSSM